jgi:hypothetical protein
VCILAFSFAQDQNCDRLFMRSLSSCNKDGLDCRLIESKAMRTRSGRRGLHKKGGREMVRISIQVSSGTARFRVLVQAESIERALEIAKRHNPGKECQVTFPIDPESFFVGDPVAKVEAVEEVAA